MTMDILWQQTAFLDRIGYSADAFSLSRNVKVLFHTLKCLYPTFCTLAIC